MKKLDTEPQPTNPPEREPGDPPQPLRPPGQKGPSPAYSNPAFIESPSARGLRILSEYMEPNARFKRYKIDDTIIFFGSARILPRDAAERRLAVAREEGAKEEDADLVVDRKSVV